MSRLSHVSGSQDKADPDRVNRVAHGVAAMLRRLAVSPVILGHTVVGRVVRWHERRKTIETLSGLDERILRDIGLFRGDIDSVVDELIDQSRAQEAANANLGRRRPERTGSPVPLGCG